MLFYDPWYLLYRWWLEIPLWRVGIGEHLCDDMCCVLVHHSSAQLVTRGHQPHPWVTVERFRTWVWSSF